MKSQKLQAKDIKEGDRIIAISKSGKTRAIVEVSSIDHEHILTTENNGLYFNTYDFYICPPALTIVPNMMVDSLKEPIIIVGKYTIKTTAFIRRDTMDSDNISIGNVFTHTIRPIPDEPKYKEITIADIEAKFGCKVKIMDGGK